MKTFSILSLSLLVLLHGMASSQPTNSLSFQQPPSSPSVVVSPNKVNCMRVSRSNDCSRNSSSTWNCLSTVNSPTCSCSCRGSCQVFFHTYDMNRNQQLVRQDGGPQMIGNSPSLQSTCRDCSCIRSSDPSVTCFCTLSCG